MLHEAQNTYNAFPSTKQYQSHSKTKSAGYKHFLPPVVTPDENPQPQYIHLIIYVISASRRIRIFEKILRIERAASFLVRVGENKWPIY